MYNQREYERGQLPSPQHLTPLQHQEFDKANEKINESVRRGADGGNNTSLIIFMACVIFFKPFAEYLIAAWAELSAMWASFTAFWGG